MKQEIVISEIDGLKSLLKEVNIWGNKSKIIKVNLPSLSETENIYIESKANEFYGTCGCQQGRVAGILTFLGYILLVITGIISFSRLGIFKTIGLYFLISFFTMSVAKFFKLRQAKYSFAKEINKIENKFFMKTIKQ